MGTNNMPYDTRIDWKRTRNVVKCWEVTDTLDQQNLPYKPKDGAFPIRSHSLEGARKSIEKRAKKGRTGLLAIYVGSMSRELVSRYFATAFEVDQDVQDAVINLDRRPRGRIALYSILIDSENAIDFHISRLAYAARVMGIRNCESNLAKADFTNQSLELKKLEDDIKNIIFGGADSVPLEELNDDILKKASEAVLDCFNSSLLEKAKSTCTDSEISKPPIDLSCQLIDFAKRNDRYFNGTEFLFQNGFFHKDLVAATKALAEAGTFKPKDRYSLLGTYTLGVRTRSGNYHTPLDSNRLDILGIESDKRKTLEFYRNALNTGAAPLGAWPSRFAPALLQQVSINRAAQLTNPPRSEGAPLPGFSPIMSTNGPPGTGKTTLLKNVVADLVVKKAHVLSRLTPDNAFEPICFNPGPDYGRPHDCCYRFALQYDEINDYGVLLCSTNNNAVANISKEWGLASKLIEDLFSDRENKLDSKKDPVVRILEKYHLLKDNELFDKDAPDIFFSRTGDSGVTEAVATWGLMGARVGNKKNREEFFNGPFEDVLERVGTVHNMQTFKYAAEEFESLYEAVQENLALDTWKAQAKPAAAQSEKSRPPVTIDGEYLDKIVGKNADEHEYVHKNNPNDIRPLDASRQKLFLLALQVIKQFFLASQQMRANLELLDFFSNPKKREELDYRIRDKFDEDYRTSSETLWQTLLLLVPVVSTTFHSVNNMFGDNPVGQKGEPVKDRAPFGLLIVDEAGQAPVHMAVGALSRCRRAMIVGDPKQIKPIPRPGIDNVESAIASRYDVLLDASESVQTLADAQNPYGAYFGKGLNRVWVGSPLLVHRRCISPMYNISNELSYDGLMIQATDPKPNRPPYLYEESRWINVAGVTTYLQVVDEQVDTAVRLIQRHFELQSDPSTKSSRLYVISPFKAVAEAIQNKMKELENTPGLDPQKLEHYFPKDDCEEKGIDPYVGTVHTFQGKEADEVIFVLGCDMCRLGAANWVESDNSILNVAVSRAKYRFYVIGDISTWKHTAKHTVADHIYNSLAKDQVNNALKPLKRNGLITATGAEAITQAMLTGASLDKLFLNFNSQANSDSHVSKRTPYGSLDEVSEHLSAADEDKDQLEQGMLYFKNYLLADWIMHFTNGQEAKDNLAGFACQQLGLAAEWYLARAYRKILPECSNRFALKCRGKKITLGTPNALINSSGGVAESLGQLTRSAAMHGSKSNASLANEPLEKWWSKFAEDTDKVAKLRNNADHPTLAKLTAEKYEEMRRAVFFERLDDADSNLGTFFTEEGIPRTLRENLDQISSLPLEEKKDEQAVQIQNNVQKPRPVWSFRYQKQFPAQAPQDVAPQNADVRSGVIEYVPLGTYVSKLDAAEIGIEIPEKNPARELNLILAEMGYIEREKPKIPTKEGRAIGLITLHKYVDAEYAGYPLPPCSPVLDVVKEALTRYWANQRGWKQAKFHQ